MKFERGYDPVKEKMKSGSKYVVSCTNCRYYYQASVDREEVCQNNAVLEYDMVVDENRIYCLLWQSIDNRGD